MKIKRKKNVSRNGSKFMLLKAEDKTMKFIRLDCYFALNFAMNDFMMR